jgi:type IX secretion system PorP/SprF family membrane protein
MQHNKPSLSPSSRIGLFILIALAITNNVNAQQTPLHPVSTRVYTPFSINPAIIGSKDFIAIDLSSVIQGPETSQLLSINTRIAKKGPNYFGAPVAKSFTPIGIGASIFHDVLSPSRNVGFSASASYHLPLNEKNISFISGGIAVKGILNMMDSIPEQEAPPRNFIIPNVDAGLYFYGQNLYAGLSATNILGNMLDSADLATYNVPVSRQYFIIAGYKILLNRSLNIVVEPSLIINLDDSLSFKSKETYNPMLKIYIESFCVGAYIHNYDNLTFFFQYKFPRLYLGTLVDFPRNAPFYKKELIIEIAAGINFGNVGYPPIDRWHW